MLKIDNVKDIKPGDIVSNNQNFKKCQLLILESPVAFKDNLGIVCGHKVKCMYLIREDGMKTYANGTIFICFHYKGSTELWYKHT